LIYDISNPSSPIIKGSYSNAAGARSVLVSSNYAYLACVDNGLAVVDISNLSSPTLKASCNTDGVVCDVSVSSNYAYIADDEKGLLIYDVSNPSFPILKGISNATKNPYDVTVSGNYAYVVDLVNGLLIFDISNPSFPVLKGSYNTNGSAFSVSVSGKYAYVADWSNGLLIFDISNPSSPIIKGSYNNDKISISFVSVSGNYAYIGNYNQLLIIDISNPSSPILKKTYDLSDLASDVSVSGNNIYVADYYDGLFILKTNLEQTVFPVADFTANPTSGYTPLTVQFTDYSQNAAGWNWDFGDGVTSIFQNPEHTYSSSGEYVVNLTLSNENVTAFKTATIHVEDLHTGPDDIVNSGSSSSGGGSPEPTTNVEVKESSQAIVASGNSAKFDFLKNSTSVVYVSFDSKKNIGRTTTTVEMLKNKSALTSKIPTGEIYKYLNIWVESSGFGTSKNIENSVVCFKVEKSWVQDEKIDKSTITLNRYSDKTWNQLPTTLSSEDDNYLYFTAKTSGFSEFAIMGKITSTRTAVQPATGNKTQLMMNDTQNNAINATANAEQTPEQTQSPNTSGKESTKTPGFEIASGIFCLLSVFLYKRR